MRLDTQTTRHHSRLNHLTKRNKRLRKEVKPTPWRDEWELEAVGRALTSVIHSSSSEESETRMSFEQALDMVTVWQARANVLDGLPHAIESTASLARVCWRDQSQQAPFLLSVMELRLAYSSAIVRCINGFADILQQQRFMAAPVSVLCRQIGIPSWIVDIRHEASHNALPTLGVLRLGASTLLEFLQTEYWVPTCWNWKGSESNNDNSLEDSRAPPLQPIDHLVQYKTCATAYYASEKVESLPNQTLSSNSSKRKEKASKPSSSNTRPFDTFFGDNDGFTSSSDDDEDDWEDSLLGSVWGGAIGTNNNRFAALGTTKSRTSKKREKQKKAQQKRTRKKPTEKYPIDHAKDFVKSVAPKKGFSTALTFLVWGGTGGAPPGRGVLIPGSAVAFPASPKGIMKCWLRYTHLLQVLGRAWPGFCATLLVHLVDFVLSIEDTVVMQSSIDAGSARKLYFLSSWIRMLLSQAFVTKLNPEFISKAGKKGLTTELELAQLSHLQKLEYPLNTLCDRCTEKNDHPEWRKTSRDIYLSLDKILGGQRVPISGIETFEPPIYTEKKFGGLIYPQRLATFEASKEEKKLITHEPADEVKANKQVVGSSELSLEEMEALLLENGAPKDAQESNKHSRFTVTDKSVGPSTKDVRIQSKEANPNETLESSPRQGRKRRAWIRCTSWDSCTIGTLPGYPV